MNQQGETLANNPLVICLSILARRGRAIREGNTTQPVSVENVKPEGKQNEHKGTQGG
jgi:hypothetical protein